MKLATTLLAFCVASLLMLGMVMLYSSSMAQVGARYLLMQLAWAGLGLVGCAVMASVDYQQLKRFAWPIYGLAILLLMFEVIKGARPGGKYLTDHVLSLLLLCGAAAEFVLLPQFGNSLYFLLTALAFVDFVSGIALRTRRGRRAATPVSEPAAASI